MLLPMKSPSAALSELPCAHMWRPCTRRVARCVKHAAIAPRAASTPAPPPEGSDANFNFNPFKRSSKKQDEARRVLQDMFKDKPDTLAFYDADGGGKGGGKGGKGRRRGGGDAGSGGFDWREHIRSWISGVGRNTSGVFKALAAALLFGVVIGAAAMLPVIWSVSVLMLRRVLRLGGAGGRRGRSLPEQPVPEAIGGAELGATERDVMAKYGGDADEYVSDGEREEGGEDEDDQ